MRLRFLIFGRKREKKKKNKKGPRNLIPTDNVAKL